MKATIKDVAKYAGVSTATVSRMLNHTGTVSAQTQQRISEAIEALDFQLNSRAQILKPEKQMPSQWWSRIFLILFLPASSMTSKAS